MPHTRAADSSDMAQTLTKLKHERQIISKKMFSVNAHGHGRRQGGLWLPIGFWNYWQEKVVFSFLRGKKQISPLLAHAWKNFWENPLLPHPVKKILPTPMAMPRRKWEPPSLSTLDMVFQCSIERIKGAMIEWLWYISPKCDTFALTQNSSFDTRWNNRVMACSSQLRTGCTVSTQMN